MKLLFDENSSRKLVARLAELYPDSVHVAEAGFLERPDFEIGEFAKAGGFVIVATTLGPPPKVVWLRRWKHPTSDGERVLRREAIRITEFASDPELVVVVLDRD